MNRHRRAIYQNVNSYKPLSRHKSSRATLPTEMNRGTLYLIEAMILGARKNIPNEQFKIEEATGLLRPGRQTHLTTDETRQCIEVVKLAADQGHLAAISMMASLHEHGAIGPKNIEQMMYYIHLGCKLGDVIAFNRIGLCYANGHGVSRDIRQAKEYFQMSARRGSETGRLMLTTLEDIINRMAALSHASLKDVEVAALNGDPNSQILLGIMLHTGIGTTKNIAEARHWQAKGLRGEARQNDSGMSHQQQRLVEELIENALSLLGLSVEELDIKKTREEYVLCVQALSIQVKSRNVDGIEMEFNRIIELTDHLIDLNCPVAIQLTQRVYHLPPGVPPNEPILAAAHAYR